MLLISSLKKDRLNKVWIMFRSHLFNPIDYLSIDFNGKGVITSLILF